MTQYIFFVWFFALLIGLILATVSVAGEISQYDFNTNESVMHAVNGEYCEDATLDLTSERAIYTSCTFVNVLTSDGSLDAIDGDRRVAEADAGGSSDAVYYWFTANISEVPGSVTLINWTFTGYGSSYSAKMHVYNYTTGTYDQCGTTGSGSETTVSCPQEDAVNLINTSTGKSTSLMLDYVQLSGSGILWANFIKLEITSVEDSCTPPASGNYEVDCSDNCQWDSADDIPGNISMSGSGINTLSAIWSFTGTDQFIDIHSSCTFDTITGGGFG